MFFGNLKCWKQSNHLVSLFASLKEKKLAERTTQQTLVEEIPLPAQNMIMQSSLRTTEHTATGLPLAQMVPYAGNVFKLYLIFVIFFQF